MKKYNYLILVAMAFSLMAISNKSLAQTNTKRADVRQHTQRARIAEGRADGELTKREAVGLNVEQRHIRRSERRAKADGEVTTQEKMRLERKQNRANRHIRRAKHNEKDNN